MNSLEHHPVANAEAIETIRNMLNSQKTAVLATIGPGGPHASLMAFAPLKCGRSITFATERDTVKFRNLQADDRAALLLDNRAGKGTDSGETLTITAVGSTRVATPEERQDLGKKLADRCPQLEHFLRLEKCVFMVQEVEFYRIVGRSRTETDLDVRVPAEDLSASTS
jgi:nitroimidazol reductase NimA-like FMN-containing flavoprotein (pyridoxamine 5'-phosphate oxidase superfamily)